MAGEGDALRDELRQMVSSLVDRALALEADDPGASASAWSAAAALAELSEDPGAAAGHREAGLAALERAALRVPPGERAAWRASPRFAGLATRSPRARAQATADALTGADEGGADEPAGLDPRAVRILDVLKRLAGEIDLDRLLARITDAAVELAGAERGYVLLVGDDGQLAPAGTGPDAPHDFSRSIAEAVLIDGEPVVAVDARRDGRFSEYRSVHQLALRSVAAVPVRGPRGPVGVLYLEHRGSRGRFEARELEVLEAFADQAAIAVENARLAGAAESRRRELEHANEALEAAKAETERVLHARTEELTDLRVELGRTREALQGRFERHGVVGRSEPMARVLALVDRVADVAVPVVIEGESGTGKEVVARAVHCAGPRAERPFVALNCGAIPEPLLESELFGHVRGAFTGAERDRKGAFARAHGGTLFLDEIADMPAKMQVDLLRVLQDGRVRPVGGDRDQEVDVRIVAASQRPVDRLVAAGGFREDLYYRLHVVRIRLPPLRERLEDLPLLCDHLLRRMAAREGGDVPHLTPSALALLRGHRFPGNVRELEHLLLGAHVLGGRSGRIEAAHLGLEGAPPAPSLPRAAPAAAVPGDDSSPRVDATPPGAAPGKPPPTSLEEFKARERRRILEALEAEGWNRARAAKSLGIPRRTFYRRLAEHGIR